MKLTFSFEKTELKRLSREKSKILTPEIDAAGIHLDQSILDALKALNEGFVFGPFYTPTQYEMVDELFHQAKAEDVPHIVLMDVDYSEEPYTWNGMPFLVLKRSSDKKQDRYKSSDKAAIEAAKAATNAWRRRRGATKDIASSEGVDLDAVFWVNGQFEVPVNTKAYVPGHYDVGQRVRDDCFLGTTYVVQPKLPKDYRHVPTDPDPALISDDVAIAWFLGKLECAMALTGVQDRTDVEAIIKHFDSFTGDGIIGITQTRIEERIWDANGYRRLNQKLLDARVHELDASGLEGHDYNDALAVIMKTAKRDGHVKTPDGNKPMPTWTGRKDRFYYHDYWVPRYTPDPQVAAHVLKPIPPKSNKSIYRLDMEAILALIRTKWDDAYTLAANRHKVSDHQQPYVRFSSNCTGNFSLRVLTGFSDNISTSPTALVTTHDEVSPALAKQSAEVTRNFWMTRVRPRLGRSTTNSSASAGKLLQCRTGFRISR